MATVVVVGRLPACSLHGTPWMRPSGRRSWTCHYRFQHEARRVVRVCGAIMTPYLVMLIPPLPLDVSA